jgi:hypothetical protein
MEKIEFIIQVIGNNLLVYIPKLPNSIIKTNKQKKILKRKKIHEQLQRYLVIKYHYLCLRMQDDIVKAPSARFPVQYKKK